MFRLLPLALVVGCGFLKPSTDDDDDDDWTSDNGGGAPPSLFGDDEEPSPSDDDAGGDEPGGDEDGGEESGDDEDGGDEDGGDEDGGDEDGGESGEGDADARPAVMITAPGDGAWFWNSDMIRFEAEVSDDITAPEDLTIRWISDIDGVFGGIPADSTGIVALETILSTGYHLITLAVTDTADNTTEVSTPLEVRDPLAHDGDLDGYSELAGDCDDADPYTSPGAEEICDAYDNDCDGEIDEDFGDAYEPNDIRTYASDLGDVASGAFLSTSITLHHSEDEDWLYFDAGDDFLIENVNVQIDVGTFHTSGSYAVELYLDDTMVDAASGSGTLSVAFEGDLWDVDEDDFWIRVYSEDWAVFDCDRELTVEVIDR